MQLQQAPHAPHQNPFLYGDLMPEEEEPTYNGLNQVTAFNTNTYSYDNNGNTTSDGLTKNYKWDAENRLIEIDYISTSNKSVFSYDGMGRRTVDAETVSGVTSTTRFLWCGSRICQTRDGTDTVQSRILPEGEYNVISTQKAVYMPDQLGSVRDVLDGTTGNLLESLDYSPFGTITQSSGSLAPAYQYAGLLYHPQSSLLMSATRAYDDKRWISRDSIRELGGLNLYGYVKDRPSGFADPKGLLEEQQFFGIPLSGNPASVFPTNDLPQHPWPAPPLTRDQMLAGLDDIGIGSTVIGTGAYLVGSNPWGLGALSAGICAEGLAQLLDPQSELNYALSSAFTFGPIYLKREGAGVLIDVLRLTGKLVHR